ncbi:MAG: succinate dehydrogenase cytochrome b subunit [Acidobacteriaceae bacterium]|nr:succinate dehydrogenase cytochrome b subunit [Acidobacteriaceae bacterium]MBV9781739.1 succinate dehydrogenase cytochrome b subunit [Acidobacteriaceae bacterium]
MSATLVSVRESRPARFWDSTNGQKIVMGITGAILFVFVIAHLLGNLQVFLGPEALNAYGRFLRGVPEILWIVRIVLLAAVILHIWSSIKLGRRKLRARPIGYSRKENIASTYASRTMYWSGPIILAFVIYHLLHLTAGIVHPGFDFVEGDVYHNVVASFQVWYVSAWYIFSMVLLGFHVRHGAWSMFQSVGINHARHTSILKNAAAVVAVLLVLGYVSIPLGILLGLVK